MSNDFRFRGHIEKITRIGRAKSGQILRAIKNRKARPMIKLFNSYVKSVLEYCNMVWNPNEQNLIEKVENVQRSFTSKIEELKEFDYYKRLKEAKIYSLERRRQKNNAIWAWKMLNGIGENIFNLEFKKEMYETKNGKMIENPKIDTWRTGGKDRVGKAKETKIEKWSKFNNNNKNIL